MRGVRILSVAVTSASTAHAHAADGPEQGRGERRDDERSRRRRPPKHWHRCETRRNGRDAEDWAECCRAGTVELRLHESERRTTSKS